MWYSHKEEAELDSIFGLMDHNVKRAVITIIVISM